MRKIGYKLGLLLGGLFILAAGLSPAIAQDKEKKEIKKEVKVMVDDDGNITVNGKPVKEVKETPDGTRMIVDDDDGRVMIIEEDDDGDRKIIRRRMHAPGADGDDKEVNVFIRRMGDAPHEILEWHEAHDAMDNARVMRMKAPMFFDEDFEFEFDFDHAGPEVMKMEAEARELARKLSTADGAEKREMEQKLSERLSHIFDKKMESRRKRVQKLEMRLQKEMTELQERQNARAQIIERRKAELLGDDKLKW